MKTVYNFVTGGLIVFFVFISLATVGKLSGYDVDFIPIAEWATKYILPWIALYWLIRLVRAVEAKQGPDKTDSKVRSE